MNNTKLNFDASFSSVVIVVPNSYHGLTDERLVN